MQTQPGTQLILHECKHGESPFILYKSKHGHHHNISQFHVLTQSFNEYSIITNCDP